MIFDSTNFLLVAGLCLPLSFNTRVSRVFEPSLHSEFVLENGGNLRKYVLLFGEKDIAGILEYADHEENRYKTRPVVRLKCLKMVIFKCFGYEKDNI